MESNERSGNMTTTMIERGKREIAEDVANGIVPNTVGSFSALHDYVDANEYGGLCDDYADATTEVANDVQNALDAWIKSGALVQSRKEGN